MSEGASALDTPHSIPEVSLLRDEAATLDFFGSHQRVADAIAAVITNNADLRVIGLLGPWGSGKSTVVRLLETKLRAGTPPHRTFTYDAWLHQSDPPRRAFLERFLDFLVAEGLVTKGDWVTPMDKLNRRVEESDTTTTPTLTAAGQLLLLSLLLVPFGTRFLGADWFRRMIDTGWLSLEHYMFPLGLFSTAAPLLVTFGFYYAWRPVRKPWNTEFYTKNNWQKHRPPHEKESLLAISDRTAA